VGQSSNPSTDRTHGGQFGTAVEAAARPGPSSGTQPGSIYTGLLEAILAETDSSPHPRSASEALAQVVRRRRAVTWNRSTPDDQAWAAVALADQLAYDADLVAYARRVGIECDPRRFGIPEVERERIERMLAARGIPLGP
jgi:hypothetical protein